MVWRPRPNAGVYGSSYSNGAGGFRATTLVQPRSYDAKKKYPLAVYVHEYGGTGSGVAGRFDHSIVHQFDNGVLAFQPTANVSAFAATEWNYWDPPSAGNDFDYIVNGLVLPAIADGWPIDTTKIYVFGYSDGCFFAQMLAFYYPTIFTSQGLVSGTPDPNISTAALAATVPCFYCAADSEGTVLYAGGDGSTLPGDLHGHPYMGAVACAALRNSWNGGAGTLQAAYDSIDLVNTVAGNETTRQAYSGTTPGTAVELWTRVGDTSHTFGANSGKGKLMFQWCNDNHRST